jgi:hypothetical protein
MTTLAQAEAYMAIAKSDQGVVVDGVSSVGGRLKDFALLEGSGGVGRAGRHNWFFNL